MGLFQFMDAKSESKVTAESTSSEPIIDSELDMTGWWRRGRVELHQKHGLAVLIAISSPKWSSAIVNLPTKNN